MALGPRRKLREAHLREGHTTMYDTAHEAGGPGTCEPIALGVFPCNSIKGASHPLVPVPSSRLS